MSCSTRDTQQLDLYILTLIAVQYLYIMKKQSVMDIYKVWIILFWGDQQLYLMCFEAESWKQTESRSKRVLFVLIWENENILIYKKRKSSFVFMKVFQYFLCLFEFDRSSVKPYLSCQLNLHMRLQLHQLSVAKVWGVWNPSLVRTYVFAPHRLEQPE